MTSLHQRLLTAEQVAERLAVRIKRVYDLPITQIKLGPRTIRWREADVDAYIAAATTAASSGTPPPPSTAEWAMPAREARPWREAPAQVERPARAVTRSTSAQLSEDDDGDIPF